MKIGDQLLALTDIVVKCDVGGQTTNRVIIKSHIYTVIRVYPNDEADRYMVQVKDVHSFLFARDFRNVTDELDELAPICTI